jgi:hypothetical protein
MPIQIPKSQNYATQAKPAIQMEKGQDERFIQLGGDTGRAVQLARSPDIANLVWQAASGSANAWKIMGDTLGDLGRIHEAHKKGQDETAIATLPQDFANIEQEESIAIDALVKEGHLNILDRADALNKRMRTRADQLLVEKKLQTSTYKQRANNYVKAHLQGTYIKQRAKDHDDNVSIARASEDMELENYVNTASESIEAYQQTVPLIMAKAMDPRYLATRRDPGTAIDELNKSLVESQIGLAETLLVTDPARLEAEVDNPESELFNRLSGAAKAKLRVKASEKILSNFERQERLNNKARDELREQNTTRLILQLENDDLEGAREMLNDEDYDLAPTTRRLMLNELQGRNNEMEKQRKEEALRSLLPRARSGELTMEDLDDLAADGEISLTGYKSLSDELRGDNKQFKTDMYKRYETRIKNLFAKDQFGMPVMLANVIGNVNQDTPPSMIQSEIIFSFQDFITEGKSYREAWDAVVEDYDIKLPETDPEKVKENRVAEKKEELRKRLEASFANGTGGSF